MIQKPQDDTRARRVAFAKAFVDYPAYLMQFVNNHCQLVDPEGEQAPPEMTHARKTSVALVCFAQFLTRMIRTRCQNSSPDMAGFGFHAAQRYNDFKRRMVDNWEIIADEKYQRAINQIEQGMVTLIFEALQREAEIDMQAGDKGNFSEAEFWSDVFNAFRLIQREDHPLWGNAIRAIYSPHDFKTALEAETNACH